MKRSASKASKREAEITTTGSVQNAMRAELREFVVRSGFVALLALLEEERTQICGPRYGRGEDREAVRNGHADGSLVLGGRRLTMRRPRAIKRNGEEAQLPSWVKFSNEDPLHERAVEQMVVGVATRKYRRSLESLDPEARERGASKSAVSRRFVARTTEQMETWLKRDLGELDLVALMIDGIVFKEHVMIVALGIDREGNKHVLGVHEGSTENTSSCTALLADIRERGIRTDRTILVVIDGGKAIRKAVKDVFGKRAVIQRCQIHKMRNVADHLPDDVATNVKRVMRQAYSSSDFEKSKRLLHGLISQLKKKYPSAANSIEDGLEETLTIIKLRLPDSLRQTFRCTNAIENLMGTIRQISRRVKQWRGGEMIERWTVTAIFEAQKKFRRIKGYKNIKLLIAALEEQNISASELAIQTEAA